MLHKLYKKKKWSKPHKKYKSVFFLRSLMFFKNKEKTFDRSVFKFRKKYLLKKAANFLSFYSYLLVLKKKRLSALIKLTIQKLSRKRKFNVQFLPEQRLDLYVSRFLQRAVIYVRRDIIQKTVLVNKKPASIHYVLKERDAIKIWKRRFFFMKKIDKRFKKKFIRGPFRKFLHFRRIRTLIFLSISQLSIKSTPRRPWVKKSYIWQDRKFSKARTFYNFLFRYQNFDLFLKK